jgi:hypothetical protein
MTSKEAILKYFCEMDIEMLEVVLDDGRTYMNARKDVFLGKVNEVFDKFKEGGDSELMIHKGECVHRECPNRGKKGYCFVGNVSGNYSNFIFDETVTEVNDIYVCNGFKIDDFYKVGNEVIKLNSEITFMIWSNEQADAVVDEDELAFDEFCREAIAEILSGEITFITEKELFDWILKYADFYRRFIGIETYGLIEKVLDIYKRLMWFCDIFVMGADAEKALNEFSTVNLTNEKELLAWLIKFEETGYKLTSMDVEGWFEEDKIKSGYYEIDGKYHVFVEIGNLLMLVDLKKLYNEYYWVLLKKYNTVNDYLYSALPKYFEEIKNYKSLTYHLKKRGMIDESGNLVIEVVDPNQIKIEYT